MNRFVADLHIHSLLSPCAAVEMTPRNIVLHALDYGINIIAITDHNAGDNINAAMEAARGSNLTILPGMEVETKEEVHVLALFESMQQFELWEAYVKAHMNGSLNDEKRFGAQFIVDSEDNLVAVKPELLLTSLACNIAQVTAKVKELGGVCIASHVDRPAYSILSQLGFIPNDVSLAAVEVTSRVKAARAAEVYPAIGSLPVISSSDAHTMEDFITGAKTIFYMKEPTLAEIDKALHKENLRKAVVVKSWNPI